MPLILFKMWLSLLFLSPHPLGQREWQPVVVRVESESITTAMELAGLESKSKGFYSPHAMKELLETKYPGKVSSSTVPQEVIQKNLLLLIMINFFKINAVQV